VHVSAGVFIPEAQIPLLALALRRLDDVEGGLPTSARRLLDVLNASAVAAVGTSAEASQGGSCRTMSAMSNRIGTRLAACQLGMTERGVRDLCERGSLAAEKVGVRWLIDPDAVTVYRSRGTR
jgi:hypothetical protein